uniref:Uncharacterized protein n=1 Tax=Ditylenchus dipsaci TaxID=166011 RepID=A0A915EBW4_9BILA
MSDRDRLSKSRAVANMTSKPRSVKNPSNRLVVADSSNSHLLIFFQSILANILEPQVIQSGSAKELILANTLKPQVTQSVDSGKYSQASGDTEWSRQRVDSGKYSQASVTQSGPDKELILANTLKPQVTQSGPDKELILANTLKPQLCISFSRFRREKMSWGIQLGLQALLMNLIEKSLKVISQFLMSDSDRLNGITDEGLALAYDGNDDDLLKYLNRSNETVDVPEILEEVNVNEFAYIYVAQYVYASFSIKFNQQIIQEILAENLKYKELEDRLNSVIKEAENSRTVLEKRHLSELKRQQKMRVDQIKTFQSQQNLWQSQQNLLQSQLKLLQSQLQEEENRSIKLEGQWIARLEEERERHRAELKIERNKRLELENHCIKNRVDEVKPNSTTDEQPVENNN